MARPAGPRYPYACQTENVPERPPGSLFGDNPSGWAFGRMGRSRHEAREPLRRARRVADARRAGGPVRRRRGARAPRRDRLRHARRAPPPPASGRRSGATSRKGAALVHDRERAHSVPVGENGLADEPCKADARDPEHPEATEPANNLRSRPKRYLRRFAGMDPENLQSYPNPYVYFFRVERDDERRPKIARAVRHLLMAETRFRR